MEIGNTPLSGVPVQDACDASAVLYRGKGFLPTLNQSCVVTVEMRWSPRHEVRVSLIGAEDEPINWIRLAGRDGPIHVRLDEVTGPDNLIAVHMRNATAEQWTGWLANRSVVGRIDQEIDCIAGHLINFVDTHGAALHGTVAGTSWTWAGRTRIDTDDWQVVVDGSPHLSSIVKSLRESGGFGRTHALQIRRLDGSSFSYSNASAIIAGLHLSLSFLLGRYTAPVYSGYRVDGSRAWDEWGTPKADQFAKGHPGSWHPHATQNLGDMTNPLLSACLDGTRKFTAKYLMQSYLAASGNDFLEQRILIAFAGIEHLAWVRLVNEDEGDPQAVNSRHADWRLRQLLSRAKADIKVPAHLPALAAFARQGNMDAPKAVANVRHLLTHPKNPSDLYEQEGLLLDTWLALRHWLALLIFHWVGYNGRIVDTSKVRGWAGETIPVPWHLDAGT